jgi:hypothetical protein
VTALIVDAFTMGGPLMMRVLGLFNKEIAKTVEMMYEWTNLYIVDTGKVETAFGLKPPGMQQALQETLDWGRSIGDL